MRKGVMGFVQTFRGKTDCAKRVMFIDGTLTAYIWAYGAWRIFPGLKITESLYRKMLRTPSKFNLIFGESHKSFIVSRVSLNHIECRRYEMYGYRVWKNEKVKR